MSLTSESTVQGAHLKLRVSGSFVSREEIYRCMDALRSEAEQRGCTTAIFDLTAAHGRTSDMDRFHLGERAAQVFRNGLRVAVVFPAAGITKFGENVAVNRGAKLAVVPDEQAAINWLEKNP
jgi:hypothetical protein